MKAALFALTCILLVGMAISADAQERKIVVFEKAVSEAARKAILKGAGGVILKDLPIIDGKAVILPAQAVTALSRTRGVVRVDDDVIVDAYPKPDKPPGGGGKGDKDDPPPPQSVPWGVDRIDADLVGSTGSGVDVAILDTGIDLDHPDLVVAGGYNAISSRKGPDDDNGHGTHVAGTVAAQDNDIGVVGVAPGASLYAVKALDRKGSGFLSDIIDGLQWCVNNGMEVVNMSLGTSANIQSFHDAVMAANTAGLIQVASAGNEGGAVGYPARYPETIAVSATGQDDTLPWWSNTGPEIDVAAPGVAINSTYKGGDYKELSGTSMAAPHVAGTVALILELTGVVETGAGLQQGDDLIGENLNLLPSEQGEGLVDAEASASSAAGVAKPVASAELSTWGQIKRNHK